ncbi:MAG: serine protease [bacterium]|nr:serine protease [bacterium]
MFNAKKIMIGLIITAFLFQTRVYADDIASQAREVKTKFENSVVIVKLVIKQKMTMQGKEFGNSETPSEIIGTVIDPSGLTVVSLMTTEPSVLMNKISESSSMQTSELKWESEISDIKIHLNDGQEIPGKIVLRDKDLDLAFIQPAEKVAALPSANIKETIQLQPLDQIIILSRLGKIASWTSSIVLGRIEAVIEKPRLFYIVSGATGIGTPAFSLDGKCIGIFVFRTIQSSTNIMSSMFSGSGAGGFMPVILPASDITEIAKQISETPANEK